MARFFGLLACAFGLLAFGERTDAPVVSKLHTISIHVDSVATYNATLRLLRDRLQWPLLYGETLPAEAGGRHYAGIWAGNVVLEICGPYPGEFQAGGPRARLHGLTWLPRESAGRSAEGLDRRGIAHKPAVSWRDLRFVLLDDAALSGPAFSLSIMEIGDRAQDDAAAARGRAALADNGGGPLGLAGVREVRVTYTDDAALAKWKLLLPKDSAGGPAVLLVKGPVNAIEAIVLDALHKDASIQQLFKDIRVL